MRAWNDKDVDPQLQQRKLVAALQATGKPLVVVATAEPHDVAYLPGVDTYVATYVYNAVGMRALTKVLVGEVRARGRLPIAIVSADDPSVTLYPYGYRAS
jgi:beta-N-acetylhexosaminidase